MTAEYPEIIKAIAKAAGSDRLRHFDLSSFYYAQGGSGSSGQRYNHGFYGHLFALLSSENPVPTYFFTYDSHNRFVFNRGEKTLWLNFFDLVGNFKIDRGDSERILDSVGKIEKQCIL